MSFSSLFFFPPLTALYTSPPLAVIRMCLQPTKACHWCLTQPGYSQPHAGSGLRSSCRRAQLFRIWYCILVYYNFLFWTYYFSLWQLQRREVNNNKVLPSLVFPQLLDTVLLNICTQFNFTLFQKLTPHKSFNVFDSLSSKKTVLFLCC